MASNTASKVSKFFNINCYGILGVKPDCTTNEITAAFRIAALKKHPDKNIDNPKATEEFQELGAVYEILKDSKLRAEYDRQNPAFHERVFKRERKRTRSAGPSGDSDESTARSFDWCNQCLSGSCETKRPRAGTQEFREYMSDEMSDRYLSEVDPARWWRIQHERMARCPAAEIARAKIQFEEAIARAKAKEQAQAEEAAAKAKWYNHYKKVYERGPVGACRTTYRQAACYLVLPIRETGCDLDAEAEAARNAADVEAKGPAGATEAVEAKE